jgi:hypothetical protein
MSNETNKEAQKNEAISSAFDHVNSVKAAAVLVEQARLNSASVQYMSEIDFRRSPLKGDYLTYLSKLG